MSSHRRRRRRALPSSPSSLRCPPTCRSSHHRTYQSPDVPPPTPPPPQPQSQPQKPPRSPHSVVPRPFIPAGFFLSQGTISFPFPFAPVSSSSAAFRPRPPSRCTTVVVSRCKNEERLREFNARGTTQSPINDRTVEAAVYAMAFSKRMVMILTEYIDRVVVDKEAGASNDPAVERLANEHKKNLISVIDKYNKRFDKLMNKALDMTSSVHPIVSTDGRPELPPVPPFRPASFGSVTSMPLIMEQPLILNVPDVEPFSDCYLTILSWEGNGGYRDREVMDLRPILMAVNESMRRPERVQFVPDDGEMGSTSKRYMKRFWRLIGESKRDAIVLLHALGSDAWCCH